MFLLDQPFSVTLLLDAVVLDNPWTVNVPAFADFHTLETDTEFPYPILDQLILHTFVVQISLHQTSSYEWLTETPSISAI